MHYQDGKFNWFSRNAYDYSGEYGASPNEGSLAPIVYEQLKKDQVESCIFDGEVLPYDETTGCYLKPSDILSTSKG
jgi:DNA ligase-4